jgi:hypothetical protein
VFAGIGVVLGFVLALQLRPSATENQLRTEAIKRGYAEWVVVDPLTGKTEFRWKDIHALGAIPEVPAIL